jgi:hypothetical protein
MSMTAQELIGRTKQATNMARDALNAHPAACTPEAHGAVVTALKANMDVADAQAEYFGNGLTESVATLVAAKMQQKKPLVVNGREFPLPSGAVLRWIGTMVTLLTTSAYLGCDARHTAPTAATAAVAAVAPTAAVANTRPLIDQATIALLRELVVGMNGNTNR